MFLYYGGFGDVASEAGRSETPEKWVKKETKGENKVHDDDSQGWTWL